MRLFRFQALAPVLLAVSSSLLLSFAHAETITAGNATPTIPATQVDTHQYDAYIVNTPFAAAGYEVTSYTFTALQPGNITPVLFTELTSGATTSFQVLGIGTLQVLAGTGTYAFGLQSGSDMTGENTYFGFVNTNGSNVAFSYDDPATDPGTFLIASPTLVAGGTFSVSSASQTTDVVPGLSDRTYSIQGNAVAVTPEPAALSLCGTGLLTLAALVRRRRPAL